MGVTRKALNWYARLAPARGKVSPPYQHVIQIGDPMLRRTCDVVPVNRIKSGEIQAVIKKLEYVILKYSSVGMSAPQIGINLRIFAMRFSSKQLASISSNIIRSRGVTELPFTVFINPTMRVVDYSKILHQEGCESVRGYTADVTRYKQVEITGYNGAGEKQTGQYSEWSARIAQHEMDHLDGVMYTDVMNRKTLTCSCWEEVNLSQGKVVLPFTPE